MASRLYPGGICYCMCLAAVMLSRLDHHHFDRFATSAVLSEAVFLGRGEARGLQSGGDLPHIASYSGSCILSLVGNRGRGDVSPCTQDFMINLIVVCENIDVRIVVHMPYQFLEAFNKRKERASAGLFQLLCKRSIIHGFA